MTQPVVPPIQYPEYVSNGPMLRLEQAIQKVGCNVAAARKARGLTSLVCPPTLTTAPIMMGQEWIAREHSPPRIVLVPTGITTAPAIKIGTEPMKGLVSQTNPRPFFVR